MKRTLAFLLVAIASAALAQTPTVVEKPAVKPTSQAKAAAKTPAQNSKPSATTVKVVPVPAQKPVAVVAKPAAVSTQPAPAKAVAVSAAPTKPSASAKPVTVATPAKPVVVAAPAAHAAVVSAKPAVAGSATKVAAVPVKADPFKSSAAKKAPAKVSSKPAAVTAKSGGSTSQTTVAIKDNKAANNDKPAKASSAVGRRDPFVSPVVNMGAVGSGCSAGKRCLAIDQIALKGVVKADSGMIAVVVNAMDKAYFLRENDPVFNGYVVKITGDSIVFKETFRDKLGKPLTRDVTKTISRPVA